MIGGPILQVKKIWSEGAWSLSIEDSADYDSPDYCLEAENIRYGGHSLDEIESKIRSESERASAALCALSDHREKLRRACEAHPLKEARERVEAVRKRFGIDFTSAAALLGDADVRGVSVEVEWARWQEGYPKMKELEEALRQGRIKPEEYHEKILELWKKYGSWISHLRFEAKKDGGDDTDTRGRGGADG